MRGLKKIKVMEKWVKRKKEKEKKRKRERKKRKN